GRRERRAVQELRAPLGRSTDRLAPPPARDRRVIAREEDRGDATTLVLDRPRVLGTLEQPLGVGFALERFALDDAGDKPGHRVVDDAVAVGRPLTDVVDDELDLSSRSRPRDDALGEGALEHLWEEREDVDPQRAHSATSCGTTTRRPPLRSTSRTTDAIAGRRSSSGDPSRRTTRTSVSPARMTSRTVPISTPSGVTSRRLSWS